MRSLTEFSLPIQGLSVGIHRYLFMLDAEFFKNFENSPIENSEIEAAVELDRRSDMLLFQFDLKGWVATLCDRCTADIKLYVENEGQLIVKFGIEKEADDDELVFISRDASEFNLANYLYEFAAMALPFVKTYDCENDSEPPCDFDVIERIRQSEIKNLGETPSGIWDSLKNLN